MNTPLILSLSLLLSFPLLFLFVPHFLPPKQPLQISLPDELDDLSLFRRASTTTTAAATTTTKKPKIAFLFLTNTNLHFLPLWDLFFRNTPSDLYNIYIHADPSSKITPPPPNSVFSNRFISSKKTQRANPTLISAARRLLAAALLDDPLNSYFALISQHCIPLHSFPFLYKSLFRKPSMQSFIEILSEQPQLWDRYVSRGENVMLPEVPFDRFRIGSQFFILTRQHALVVVRDRRLWRKFKLPCLNLDSCYPEEHYFPTLLSMEDPDGCTRYTLTRVNWTGSVGGHPHTYRPHEVSPRLIEELRKSNSSSYSFMFARKFSPDSLRLLMGMAEKVIFRD